MAQAKWRLEDTSTAFAVGMGNHVEKHIRDFATRKDLLKWAYNSPIGYVSTNTRGRVYDIETGKVVAYIDSNKWYTKDTKGNVYCRSFKYGAFVGEKWLYDKAGAHSYIRDKLNKKM